MAEGDPLSCLQSPFNNSANCETAQIVGGVEIGDQSLDGALGEALDKTWRMSWLTLKVLGKLVVGEASIKNLSGPITIAKYAGISARIGFEQFLGFLAIISISLGVLNLLPVPILDGGHLFYYLIEMIKGSPVSETTELIGQKIGMALLFGLMSIAIYNDLLRLVA